jgi:AcrR family transcriptional regulator
MGKGALTHSRILDEGVRIARLEGLEGLTIGGLAAALSLSKSGLFSHFGSRTALQAAVLEHALARLRERMGPVQAQPPGQGRIRALMQVILDWVDDPEQPGGCPILAAGFELDDAEGPVRDLLVANRQTTERWLGDQFRAFACREADVEQLVFEFQGITMAYHYAVRVMRRASARERAWKALDGLLERARQ